MDIHRDEDTGMMHTHEISCLKPSPRIWQTLIVTLFLVVCVIQTPGAAENKTITCGVILPLSGHYEPMGTGLLQGIEIAAEETAKTGNTSGYQVILRIADDEGDPQKALSLFKEMQGAGIPVVIGSYTTTITLPMAKETLNSDTTLLISPRANGEELYGISPRFYQVNPPVRTLAEYVSDWLKYSSDRTTVIYVDDAYGRSVLEHIRTGLKRYSVQPAGSFPLREDTDYQDLAEKVVDSASDTVVIIIYDQRQIPVICNLSEAGFQGQVILTESSFMETLEKEIPGILSKFSLVTISSHANRVPGEHADQFVSSYGSRFGEDPSRTVAGYGYDSLMVVAEALRTMNCINETITADMIQKGLDESRYYGVTGPKDFDSRHAAGPAMDRWGFLNGTFELMTISLK
jgi:branched-chain amino acid transport system substrate-binding protein